MSMYPRHEVLPDGTPYEYTLHRQDLDEGRAVVTDAIPAFKVTTLMAFDVLGEPLSQKTICTVLAGCMSFWPTHAYRTPAKRL